MQLDILGMEGPFPGSCGATSGYFVSGDGYGLELDMGSGTLGRLTAIAAPENLTALVVSHWHEDHTSDILPLLFRLAATFSGRKLPVYGPYDGNSVVRSAVEKSPFVELHTVRPGDQVNLGKSTLQFFKANHPVPALMIEIDADGKKFCYTGDTNETSDMQSFAENADMLLCDGLFPESQWSSSKPHLSAKMAGEIAAAYSVKKLVVTHLNPLIDKNLLLQEARSSFSAARLAKCLDKYEI